MCNLYVRGETLTESDLPQFQGEKISFSSSFVDLALTSRMFSATSGGFSRVWRVFDSFLVDNPRTTRASGHM